MSWRVDSRIYSMKFIWLGVCLFILNLFGVAFSIKWHDGLLLTISCAAVYMTTPAPFYLYYRLTEKEDNQRHQPTTTKEK